MAIRTLLVASLLCLCAYASQKVPSGSQIYEQFGDSVFLLVIEDSKGELTAQGSGFAIDSNRIVTNAHVANAGKVWIQIGKIKIPTVKTLVDTENDIAILQVDANISSKPFQFSAGSAKVGDRVFAIGNPEGLERTFSEGNVSGIRKSGTKTLIQITSPISHGSSGGPILDDTGKVIGVAVGMIGEGQNLNFAVPIERVQDLLSGVKTRGTRTTTELLTQVDELLTAQKSLQYSAEPGSDWQTTETQITTTLKEAFGLSLHSENALLAIADKATYKDTDLSIAAAKQALALRSSPTAHSILAEALYMKAIFENAESKNSLLKDAEEHAELAIAVKEPSGKQFYRLALILEAEEKPIDSAKYYRATLASKADTGMKAWSYRALIGMADTNGKPAEAIDLFAHLQEVSEPLMRDWDSQGDRLIKVSRYKDAGEAYVKAATLGASPSEWCYAANAFWGSDDDDRLLSLGRTCLEKNPDPDKFKGIISGVERAMASVLINRGVYAEALNYAKQAISLQEDEPWGFYYEGKALQGLHRYQEAVAAEKQAIRLSDGKFSDMHFALGAAWFELENWDFARESFEKAAELDVKNEAAAYNVALSFARLGFYRDAANWYQEVLKRNPNRQDKQDLVHRIDQLRR